MSVGLRATRLRVRARVGEVRSRRCGQIPACSSAVSSRRTLAGTPATSEPGGITAPSSTTAPPATRHPSPITAPERMTLPMPISDPSPIVQPWTTALCPTETSAPIDDRVPGVDVHRHVVLQVAARTDRDRVAVGAQHRVVPDAGTGGQAHRADQRGPRSRRTRSGGVRGCAPAGRERRHRAAMVMPRPYDDATTVSPAFACLRNGAR